MPQIAPEDLSSIILRNTRLGVRGSLRMAQTMYTVSPSAMKWLLQWRAPTPAELRRLFERLGATYIKFGQFIASSPSIFPPEYVEEFQLCLDRTPPLPFARIRKIVEEDLGRPLHEIYKHVDEQPLASASIAQVHAATLYNGADVVIKVRKPGVKNILTTDMNAVWLLTRIVELIVPNMGRGAMVGIVEEMYNSMLDECDFVKEADNLEQFQRFLDERPGSGVRSPKPWREACSERVLTMERFYGIALTDKETLKNNTELAGQSLIAALNTWFASITGNEFFHADLHSGNLMLLREGGVGFIDFGMVGRIKPGAWQAIFGLFGAIEQEDHHAIAQAMIDIGATDEVVDSDALAKEIESVFKSLYSVESVEDLAAGKEGGVDAITELMNKLGNIARGYGIRFPRSFTLLLKQFLYFDRYLDLLTPGVDLFGGNEIDMGGLGF